MSKLREAVSRDDYLPQSGGTTISCRSLDGKTNEHKPPALARHLQLFCS